MAIDPISLSNGVIDVGRLKPHAPRWVEGEACLAYVNRPIGFVNKGDPVAYANAFMNSERNNVLSFFQRVKTSTYIQGLDCLWADAVYITHQNHDPNKRICGYVDRYYDDGGMRVIVFGNEGTNGQGSGYYQQMTVKLQQGYSVDSFTITKMNKNDPIITGIPEINPYVGQHNLCRTALSRGLGGAETLDKMLDWTVDMNLFSQYGPFCPVVDSSNMINGMLSTDKDHTLIFGQGITLADIPDMHLLQYMPMGDDFVDNPLRNFSGDLYALAIRKATDGVSLMPASLNVDVFALYDQPVQQYRELSDTNLVAIPFNLLLTNNEYEAINYVNTGQLPSDAWLYPLDWDNLPSVDDVDEEIDPDTPDDDDDIDDDLDIDVPAVPSSPTITPGMLSNNNYYWLSAPELDRFITWFWKDITDSNIFDDIINKITGLYTNLDQAILMIRFMPTDVNNLGGTGANQNIRLGLIEKGGSPVATLNTASSPPLVTLGHVTIPKIHNSFLAYEPYSEVQVYLPFFGFLPIDINLYTGHEMTVKAAYDFMSGTIQYFILRDNVLQTNTAIAKMSVDIPITLQSKRDRDDAIMQNVKQSITSAISAVQGVANKDIGSAIGGAIDTFYSPKATAPYKNFSYSGETGAYYQYEKCFILYQTAIPRMPGTKGSDARQKYKQRVGNILNKVYKLSQLEGSGFTMCKSPQIDFKNTIPLESEQQEIYNALEKGVIL